MWLFGGNGCAFLWRVLGCREPQFGSLQTEDMYRGRGYPRKTLVAAGPEGGACAVKCVCLHAGTYEFIAQVQD